jgi:hypothetical protein
MLFHDMCFGAFIRLVLLVDGFLCLPFSYTCIFVFTFYLFITKSLHVNKTSIFSWLNLYFLAKHLCVINL